MEKARLAFLQMIGIVLNVIGMVLVLFTNAYISDQMIVDFVLLLSTATFLVSVALNFAKRLGLVSFFFFELPKYILRLC